MDKKDVTIVICCAGMGTRLGIGTTKALVNICGKPLILHQLENLIEYDDIRIVLGYQAERVIELVSKYRRDVMFAFNYDYKKTGAAASLSKGILGAREYTVSLDGDLIVKPQDLKKFLEYDRECIAISKCNSDEPVYIDIENGKANKFSEISEYEWSGLAKVKTEHLTHSKGHIYEMLEKVFPIDALNISSMDIDTPEDYERAIAWVESKYK